MYSKYNRLIIKIAIGFLLIGCVWPQIQVEKFKGFTSVKKGEKAKLFWSFKNASKVIIQGDSTIYNPEDSVEISINESKKFNVTAYQKEYDSLTMTSSVEVIQEPEHIESTKYRQNNSSSDFFIGYSNDDKTDSITNLKILKVEYPENNNEKLKFSAILIDKNGNLIKKSKNFDKQFSNNIVARCKDEVSSNSKTNLNYEQIDPAESHLEINILADNSIQVPVDVNFDTNIGLFLKNIADNDRLTYSKFNQNLNLIFQNTSPGKANSILLGNNTLSHSGMNAMYKDLYKSLGLFSKNHTQKILIIISYNSDNSSILFTSSDVTKLARKLKIPIYTIAVGNGLATYPLRYLSNATGGRFYHIGEDEIDQIQNILTEIYYSQRTFFSFELTQNEEELKCNKTVIEATINGQNLDLTDKAYIINRNFEQYSPYQALASFDFKSIDLQPEYDENINNLAEILRNNPDAKIELLGHSGIEGDDKFLEKVSLKRAELLKNILVTRGIKESQIKIKGVADKKPLFFFENEIWQGYYNRRVEIKWLDPSVLPFELIGDVFKSEDEVIKRMEFWQDKGYKVYYDRISIGSTPNYRIKLWGFATEEEANSVSKKINKQFKVKFTID